MMDRLAPAGITIALQPDADGECAENLRLALRGALGHLVEIDLGRVPYLTSSALAVLARFRRESGGEPHRAAPRQRAGLSHPANRRLQQALHDRVPGQPRTSRPAPAANSVSQLFAVRDHRIVGPHAARRSTDRCRAAARRASTASTASSSSWRQAMIALSLVPRCSFERSTIGPMPFLQREVLRVDADDAGEVLRLLQLAVDQVVVATGSS